MMVAGFSRHGAMRWHLFLGASILVGGSLYELGVPLPSVSVGIGLAAILHWTRARVTTPPGSNAGL